MRRALLLAAALVAAASTPAAAQVPAQLVVEAEGAQAIVETSPFRLSFRDGATGNVVLRQVPGSPVPAASAKLLPSRVGQQEVAGAPPYLPLGFQVGGEAEAPGASIHAGNIAAGMQAGTVFSPQQVQSFEEADGGYRMTVSTSSPLTNMVVTVTPDEGRAIRVRASLTQPSGVAAMGDAFVAGEKERFHGFGGRRNAIDQRGRSFYGWTEEEGGYRLAYYPQNQFVSSAGYGFLLNETRLSMWHMAADRPDAWQVDVQDDTLDYTVAVGDAPKVIRTLTAITGSHKLPAEWAHEPTLSQPQVVGGETHDAYRGRVEADLAKLEAEPGRFAVGAYAIEAWRGMGDDWVRGIVARLRAMGMRPIGYVRPFVYADEYFNTQSEYDEVYAQGLGTRTAAGTQYLQPGIFGFPTLNLDFTNPATNAWWERRLRYMLDLGFDGFMQDFGEEISPDMHFFDGSTGEEMHNAYPTLFHKLSRGIVDAYAREHPERGQIFFYTRAGFSGRPGSAAYENSNFPGDETASWTHVGGLPTIFPDLLSRGIGGAFGYNTDIGGYVDPGQGAPPVADNYDFGGPTDKELYLRWTQASAFLPFFRVHNNQRSGVKMPWSFDEEAKDAWVAMALLHRRATPLIRRLWREFPKTGIPPSAPLWLMAPGDEKAATQTFEFMVGQDLLVAPVVEQGATSRRVYFPAGCWQHGESGERFEGGRESEVRAPVTSLPWFVRCGTNPLFAGEQAGLGLPRRCTSRRRFTIRLRNPRGDRLVRARVYVNGKRVRVLRGRRLRARVDLRGLRRGRSTVRIEGVGRSGRRYVETRRYRTCSGPRRVTTPKRPRRKG